MSRRPSPLDTEQCRQCSSFTDYIRIAKKKVKNETASSSQTDTVHLRRTDCPLDRDELGNKSWGLLHTIAAKYPNEPSQKQEKDMKDFFSVFSRLYPCEHCAENLKKELRADPPKTESQQAFSQWLCHLHNKVNVRIGKDEFDCSKVNERWRDGWLDGSCDDY